MLPYLNNYRFARNKNTDSLQGYRLSDGRVVYRCVPFICPGYRHGLDYIVFKYHAGFLWHFCWLAYRTCYQLGLNGLYIVLLGWQGLIANHLEHIQRFQSIALEVEHGQILPLIAFSSLPASTLYRNPIRFPVEDTLAAGSIIHLSSPHNLHLD